MNAAFCPRCAGWRFVYVGYYTKPCPVCVPPILTFRTASTSQPSTVYAFEPSSPATTTSALAGR